jgi:hypothetical protein
LCNSAFKRLTVVKTGGENANALILAQQVY